MSTEDKVVVPVFLRAVDAVLSNENITGLIFKEAIKYSDSGKSPFSIDDLKNGRLLVLLDAIDEISDQSSRENLLSKVILFGEKYPECRIIATSRNYPFVKTMPELGEYLTFNISPINHTQISQIIKRASKGKSLPEIAMKEIVRRIQHVHGFDLNPLMVTIFVATSDYSRKDVPANITELFKKYTEMMLGRWDASKKLSQQYHAPLKDLILKEVAHEMHEIGITSIKISRLVPHTNRCTV